MSEHKTKTIYIGDKEVEIDIKCVDLVKLFNQEGLMTKHSCQGDAQNDFSIIFDDSVTDNDMITFISKFKNIYGHSPFIGKFSKWCRLINNKLTYNWMYTAKDYNAAHITYMRLKTILEKTYNN